MKPRISPEEYREILEAITLDNLYLVNIKSRLQEEYLSKELELNISEKFTFEQIDNTLKILYSYKLSAKDETKEKPAMVINADYIIKYNIQQEILIPKDFMKIFGDLTLGMLTWTYFRELVSNLVYRMGMPSLVLPMKRR